MLNIKKLRLLLIGVSLTIVSGCSNGSSPVTGGIQNFGEAITSILGKEKVVLGFMFVAMMIGTFALFKGLLKFSFMRGYGENIFGNKEVNVIAAMLSIIGTTGIFYIFRASESIMITYFGGSVGLLFVLFICFFMMHMFFHFAESFKVEDGALGKGPGWIFIMLLGIIFSAYLLIGYTGQVLTSLGCKFNLQTIQAIGASTSCNGASVGFFYVILKFLWTLLPWLVIIGIIAGIMWWTSKNKDKAAEYEKATSGEGGKDGMLGRLFNVGKPKTDKDVNYDKSVKSMQGNMKLLQKELANIKKSANKQHEILSKIHRELGHTDFTPEVSGINNSGSNGDGN